MLKRLFLILLPLLIVAVAGWLWWQRVPRVAMEGYVPESALGYIEINDLPQLMDRFTSTKAWQQLAPVYGISDKLNYFGKAGTLARITGAGPAESVMLSRAQFALTVTGIEVRGREVIPRWALVAETHTSESRLKSAIESRLPQLAAQAFGNPARETMDYLNVPVTVFRAALENKRMLSAQMGSVWILANHPDAMRACIETRLGRSPSMASSNFHLSAARPMVGGNSEIFAFISKQGAARLTQFAANLLLSRVTSAAAVAGVAENLLSDLSGKTVDGIAYGATFEQGEIISRSALLFKPAIADKLKNSIRPGENSREGHHKSLSIIPASATDVTIVDVQNPLKVFDELELAFSSQLGAGQSFILRQYLIGARAALFGLAPGDSASAGFGNEIVAVSLGEKAADRVLLIEAGNRALTEQFAQKYLTIGGANLRREKYQDSELLISSSAQRGSGVFIREFLVLGSQSALKRLLDAQQKNDLLEKTPQFQAALRNAEVIPVISYSSAKEDVNEMMFALAQRLNGKVTVDRNAANTELSKLPLATSWTTLHEHGAQTVSRAPFGNFPLLISMIDGAGAN
jgi:hypothetical protein